MRNGKIPLVENKEKSGFDALEEMLENEGFTLDLISREFASIALINSLKPNLMMIDRALPIEDNYQFCRQIKSHPDTDHIFVMIIADLNDETAEIEAFENGADDYVTRPLKLRALTKRVNQIFDRKLKNTKGSSLIENGDLVINHESYSVYLSGRELNLPKKEFDLLRFLASNPHKVFTRDDLLYNIWESDYEVQPRTIDVHIRKIRDKIGEGFISTVKGVGYRFNLSAKK